MKFTALGRWINFSTAMFDDKNGLVGSDLNNLRTSPKNGLTYMTLRDFIDEWQSELEDYYEGEFSMKKGDLITDSEVGDTLVFCMVDNDENVDHLPDEIRKKIRKAGKWRRNKLKHQWSYINPLNRIHGYIILKDVTNKEKGKRVLSISSICSTYFTKKKGIGTDLMKFAKEYATKTGYSDIVLEVANEYSGMGFEDSEDEESGDEESEDEESEDENDIWYPCEGAIDILAEEFWKKCMRKNNRGIPEYNLEQEYIEESIRDYMFCELNSEDPSIVWEGTSKKEILDEDEPGESEYGGFWYKKGKKSQERLMKFYEMHGYKEDPDVYLNWGCFSEIPYPTMRLNLE